MAVKRNTQYAQEVIFKALSECGELDFRECADYIGLSDNATWELMDKLHGECLIHVARWERQERSGPPVKIFAIGNYPDAEKLPPLTTAEKSARHRRKLKETDPEKYAERSQAFRKKHRERMQADPKFRESELKKGRALYKKKTGFYSRPPVFSNLVKDLIECKK